jgi:Putative Flp pilus-assembly TadE/G-like
VIRSRLLARVNDERGVVAVVVALLLVALLASSAVMFDIARLRHEKHILQAAVDLGSLAGAGYMPVQGSTAAGLAESTARNVAEANGPGATGSNLIISFGCVVSDPDGDGGQDAPDLKFACGPANAGTWTSGWTSVGGRAIHACNPYAGDLCNTIRLEAASTISYLFAPILGYDTGSTGAVRAAACKGFCGQASSPLDVVIVVDRSTSMTVADMANVKSAISNVSPAKDSVLEFYDPADVNIGLVALPYYRQPPGSKCDTQPSQVYPNVPLANGERWKLVDLSNDYQNADGTLNGGSQLVSIMSCLMRATSVNNVNFPGGHTNHGDPLHAAANMLAASDPDIPDVIVYFADGEANQPNFQPTAEPCNYANIRATNAKANDVLIFTLGYGIAGARCTQDDTGPFANPPTDWATTFMSRMASEVLPGVPSSDNQPGGCDTNPNPQTENTDNDFYFCESAGTDLEATFLRIAVQSIQRTRLLNF